MSGLPVVFWDLKLLRRGDLVDVLLVSPLEAHVPKEGFYGVPHFSKVSALFSFFPYSVI